VVKSRSSLEQALMLCSDILIGVHQGVHCGPTKRLQRKTRESGERQPWTALLLGSQVPLTQARRPILPLTLILRRTQISQ
jgi:hypothetical protein